MAQYVYAEDLSFVTGDSPYTLSVVNNDTTSNLTATLPIDGGLATGGYIKNTGSGVLQFALDDGSGTYGSNIRLASGETHNFERSTMDAQLGKVRIKIARIKITWVSDTAWKLYLD